MIIYALLKNIYVKIESTKENFPNFYGGCIFQDQIPGVTENNHNKSKNRKSIFTFNNAVFKRPRRSSLLKYPTRNLLPSNKQQRRQGQWIIKFQMSIDYLFPMRPIARINAAVVFYAASPHGRRFRGYVGHSSHAVKNKLSHILRPNELSARFGNR